MRKHWQSLFNSFLFYTILSKQAETSIYWFYKYLSIFNKQNILYIQVSSAFFKSSVYTILPAHFSCGTKVDWSLYKKKYENIFGNEFSRLASFRPVSRHNMLELKSFHFFYHSRNYTKLSRLSCSGYRNRFSFFSFIFYKITSFKWRKNKSIYPFIQ